MGIDKVGRVELLGAIVTLVATRAGEATVGAGALDIAIRQETTVSYGIDLTFSNFLDQPDLSQTAREGLC